MDSRAHRREQRDRQAERTAARERAGRNTRGRSRWRRFRRRLGDLALRTIGPLFVRLLAFTWRVERCGDRGFALLRADAPWIVAMWHGRMLTLMPLRHHAGRRIGVLVSPSDDGSLATRALSSFGYRIVRGSLSRGGARALREMRELLLDARQLVITPDGPRGPRHGMNVGAAWLARATSQPILPVGVAVDRAWRLRSWDRFTIPKPFARLVVVYGDPVHVPASADDQALQAATDLVRTRLLAAERAGFATLRCAPDTDDMPGDATSGEAP